MKLWLGDHEVAAEVGSSAVELLSERLGGVRDRRKFNRMIENFAEAVADRLDPVTREFHQLPEHERLATIEAVKDTFEKAALVDADLFAADLDASHLEKAVLRRVPDQTALLSEGATGLYKLLLRECCGYVIEISRGLPIFSSAALTEILQRETSILELIREVLSRLPQRDRAAGFEYEYRQLVARKLDRVEIFGVSLLDQRKYSLSVAYISLTAISSGGNPGRKNSRVDELLASQRRLFIRGDAGLGKTTLLQWIAVRSARSDFPAKLADWNRTVPFFLPLRRYTTTSLPSPEQFVAEIGRHIADEMGENWVHQKLRSGQAIVLIDGVDEMPADRRDDAKVWLNDLVSTFASSRFVVTSRPGATKSDWLSDDEFMVVDLEPMNRYDVRTFVHRWHEANRAPGLDEAVRAELDEYEQSLLSQLDKSGHLRKLAGYPLLCALLCALNREHRAALPSNRMELYDVALKMLLARRDPERRLPALLGLDYTKQVLLLADLAYWLIRNGHSDVAVPRAISRLRERITLMSNLRTTEDTLYQHLLERSGLLREPVVGRVDFIHRTFQEYLAAKAAVDADDIGQIVANAHLDQWHEVVIMAAGHATFTQREELLAGLLARADEEPVRRDALVLLAMASLGTSAELSASRRAEIERRAATLLPPNSVEVAKSFALAGAFVLDLLASSQPSNATETAFVVRGLVETGLDEALPILEKYSTDTRATVLVELIRGLDKFHEDTYGATVLANIPFETLDVSLNSNEQLRALRHLRNTKRLRLSLTENGRYDGSLLPPQVTHVRVSGMDSTRCNIEFTGSSELLDCQELAIYSARILVPELFNFMPHLKVLHLNRCTIARTIRPSAALRHLTELKIRYSDVLDLASFGPLPNLKELDLTGVQVKDIGAIARLSTLETVRISEVTPSEIAMLEKALPSTSFICPPTNS